MKARAYLTAAALWGAMALTSRVAMAQDTPSGVTKRVDRPEPEAAAAKAEQAAEESAPEPPPDAPIDADAERAVPDYDGRPEPTTAGDVLI